LLDIRETKVFREAYAFDPSLIEKRSVTPNPGKGGILREPWFP